MREERKKEEENRRRERKIAILGERKGEKGKTTGEKEGKEYKK